MFFCEKRLRGQYVFEGRISLENQLVGREKRYRPCQSVGLFSTCYRPILTVSYTEIALFGVSKRLIVLTCKNLSV